jgi:hypothetical protein
VVCKVGDTRGGLLRRIKADGGASLDGVLKSFAGVLCYTNRMEKCIRGYRKLRKGGGERNGSIGLPIPDGNLRGKSAAVQREIAVV